MLMKGEKIQSISVAQGKFLIFVALIITVISLFVKLIGIHVGPYLGSDICSWATILLFMIGVIFILNELLKKYE